LIPSSVKINDISRILREGFDIERLFAGLQEFVKSLQLDYLFIDTHPGLNEETLLSLTISNIVLLVLRPDQQDFQGTAVTIDVARRLKVPKLLLVVNKVLEDYDFTQLQQQIQGTYNVPVVGLLPETPDLLRLGSRGLFTFKNPHHKLTKVIVKIVQEITK
jgi:MinD-like ATPase involved in chromosome partitioning or flagellar assembly